MRPDVTTAAPLRVLMVIPSLDLKYGGPPESIRTLSSALTQLGHQCEILTQDEHDLWRGEFVCPVTCVGAGIGNYRYSPRLRRWLTANAHRFDVVVVNGVYQYLGIATRVACLRADVPYVVFTHGSLDPWFRKRFPIKHLKKWIWWLCGGYQLLRDATRVLYTTTDERDLARQTFWLFRDSPAVVGYGTAAPPEPETGDYEHLVDHFPALRNRRFILFLSRIDRKKGCNLLIEAFARIADSAPDLVLVMAGPDNSGWQAELQALAGGLHVADRIVWTGPLAGSLKWAAFRHAEAFALTSHTENFGIVVVEALACGTPVLISDKVNIWREVVDGGAGYVESDTLDGSVQLLNRWLATDLESRRIMSSAAISVFYERFEINAVAKVIAEELQRCVNREER